MIKQSIIFTILFVSTIGHNILRGNPKNKEALVQTHDEMVKEFSRTIKLALSHVNPLFKNFEYDVASPQYSLNWTHGNVPDLNVKYYL